MGRPVYQVSFYYRLKRRVAVEHPKWIDINQNGMYIAPDKRKNIKDY